MKYKCDNIRNNNTHENRDDSEHSLSPDVEHDDYTECDERNEPVGGSVAHGRRCKTQTDTYYDWSRDHRRKKSHNLIHTHKLDDECEHKI